MSDLSSYTTTPGTVVPLPEGSMSSQNDVLSVPPPPPPPPPPLAPPAPRAQLGLKQGEEPGGTLYENASQLSPEHLKDETLRMYKKDMGLTGARQKTLNVFLVNRPFDPIIQQGPTCGMVALAMLARMLGKGELTTEVFVNHAREKGYTKQGELFSVDYAQSIMKDLLQFDVIVEPAIDCPWSMCRNLIDHALLFPYDSDKNCQPAQKKGTSAHWALITGFCLILDGDPTQKQQEFHKHHRTGGEGDGTSCSDRETLLQALNALEKDSQASQTATVYVFGRQGRSMRVLISRWTEMVQSSHQLTELGEERKKDPVGYILPEGGMAVGLKGRYVKVPFPPEGTSMQVSSFVEQL